MKTVTSLNIVYSGRLSRAGYVGPTIVVTPDSRTLVVDELGATWDVRVGPETDGVTGRCVSVEMKPQGSRRWQPANALRA